MSGTNSWLIFGEQTRVNSRECRSLALLRDDHRLNERVERSRFLHHTLHQLLLHGIGKDLFLSGVGEYGRERRNEDGTEKSSVAARQQLRIGVPLVLRPRGIGKTGQLAAFHGQAPKTAV